MRTIVIDIRPLLPKNPPSGVPEYTRELVSAMAALIAKKAYPCNLVLFSSGSQKADLSFLGESRHVVRPLHLSIPNRLFNISCKLLSFPRIDRLVASRLKLSGDMVFFAPNINLFPLSRKAKLVITFHDLSFERYPFFLKFKERMWHATVNPRAIAKRANAIIAVSRSTKDDLVELYGIPEKRLRVVYSGISSTLRPISPAPSKPYKILYFGSAEGRKNVHTLKKAFALLQKRLKGIPLELVWGGAPKDPVSPEGRLALYQQASLFVYPSVFEGFGFPPLEAMACGVPVITSHTSSLPEAVGDGALMVNPHHAYEFASAMKALLTDEQLRVRYREKGFIQVKKFTWDVAARRTIETLLRI